MSTQPPDCLPVNSTWIKNKETLLVLQTLLNLRTLPDPLTQHLDKTSSSTTLSRNPTTVTPLRSNYVSLATWADRSKSFGALQALQTESSGDLRFKSSLATFTHARELAQNVTLVAAVGSTIKNQETIPGLQARGYHSPTYLTGLCSSVPSQVTSKQQYGWRDIKSTQQRRNTER